MLWDSVIGMLKDIWRTDEDYPTFHCTFSFQGLWEEWITTNFTFLRDYYTLILDLLVMASLVFFFSPCLPDALQSNLWSTLNKSIKVHCTKIEPRSWIYCITPPLLFICLIYIHVIFVPFIHYSVSLEHGHQWTLSTLVVFIVAVHLSNTQLCITYSVPGTILGTWDNTEMHKTKPITKIPVWRLYSIWR